MGVAAYNRGSRVISRQADRALGLPEPTVHKPTPRPASWGEKARDRALTRARRILLTGARAGLRQLDEASLAELLVERERVGAETARAAAALALAETSK